MPFSPGELLAPLGTPGRPWSWAVQLSGLAGGSSSGPVSVRTGPCGLGGKGAERPSCAFSSRLLHVPFSPDLASPEGPRCSSRPGLPCLLFAENPVASRPWRQRGQRPDATGHARRWRCEVTDQTLVMQWPNIDFGCRGFPPPAGGSGFPAAPLACNTTLPRATAGRPGGTEALPSRQTSILPALGCPGGPAPSHSPRGKREGEAGGGGGMP